MDVVVGQAGLELGVNHPPFLLDLFRGKQWCRQHVGQLGQAWLQALRADRAEKTCGVGCGAGIKAPTPLRHPGRKRARLRPAS